MLEKHKNLDFSIFSKNLDFRPMGATESVVLNPDSDARHRAGQDPSVLVVVRSKKICFKPKYFSNKKCNVATINDN